MNCIRSLCSVLFKKTMVSAMALLLLSAFAVGQESETLPWRPACQPISGPWLESFNSAGNQEICYYNSTAMFVQARLSRNFAGQLFKRANPDAFIQGINYLQPVGNYKVDDIRIIFEYYFPFYEDGTECPVDPANVNAVTGYHNNPQYILVGNNDADFYSETDTFDDAIMNFTLEGACGQWYTFNHTINDFGNDYGSSFSRSNRDLGTVGLEAANIYIKNVKVIGAADPPVVQIW